ncbi:MAG TPA: hypothetical protein PKC91_06970 [Ignavibacteria bacterium]|nr:hypothetical protein [Ignavibacteria bacterium]
MNKINFRNKGKYILTIAVILLSIGESISQPLLVDNFNYSVRDTLEGIGNWSRSGPNTNRKIKVVSPGLNYAGYACSGIGNTAFFTNQPDGDVNINQIDPQTSGSVYMSFMIRVDSLTAATTEGYNICMDEAGGSTNFNTKIFIKKISSSTFNFGIRKYDGPIKYSPVVYSKNTTYLVICSYTFINGASNDIARLYVNTSGVPATEPVTPSAADTASLDVSNIGDIILSNLFIQSGLQGSTVKIDGIRVGTSWASTLFQPYTVQLNLKAFIQGFYNSATNKMVKDTARVYLAYNRSPFLIADSSKAVLDSIGNGSFVFSGVGNRAPYFIIVKHRNTIATWSWSPREFDMSAQNFDFTPFASYAYENNQILKGSRYCLYNGDANQDDLVDLTDIVAVNNNANTFTAGYKSTDMDGNNITDLTDVLLTYNNSNNFVSTKKP